MAEENGGSKPSISTRFKGYFRESPFFCKIIELILCVISVALFSGPFNHHMQPDLTHAGITYVGTCAFILINSVLILCYLLGEKLGRKTALTFCGLGVILSLIAGITLINDRNNYQDNYISRYEEEYLAQMLASGVFALLASVIFVIDTYLTHKYE